VSRERGRRGAEVRLPQARPDAPPGPQSQQPGRVREVQGGVRGVRRALRSREAGEVRPLRPRGTVGRLRLRGGFGFDPTRSAICPSSSKASSGSPRVRGAAAGPSAAAISSTGWRSPSATRPSASRRRSPSPRLEACEPCSRLGRRARHAPKTCPACAGNRTPARLAGIPDGHAPVRPLPRRGQRHREPLPRVRRRGAPSREEGADDPHSRRRRVRLPAAPHRRGRRGTERRPPGRSLRRADRCADEVFEREGDDVVVRVELPFPTLALGGTVEVPTLDAPEKVTLDPGTQPGAELKLRGRGFGRWAGRAGETCSCASACACRPRPRRRRRSF
jgi:hypothetical protein